MLKAGKGAILRLSDVATVVDGIANTRLAALIGKHPAILLTITKSAGANVIETVDRIHGASAADHGGGCPRTSSSP